MTQPNILELAKQGDARAITSLLNRSLQPKGITAKAAKRDGILHVLLEGQTPPNQPASIRCIHQGLQKLGFVDTPITIYGREQGSAEVCWQSHLDAPLIGDLPMETGDAPSELPVAELPVTAERLAPPPPPPLATEETEAELGLIDDAAVIDDAAQDSESWDSFDFRAADSDDPTVVTDSAEDGRPEQAWNNDYIGDDFALDSPDEPTLIVPPQPDEELDNSLSDEDSDSEILLSLWDDADIDEDDMLEPSAEGRGEDPDLWKDGSSDDALHGEGDGLAESPGLIGEPQPKRKGSTLFPLVLLAFLGILGGAAVASRMGMVRLPWLANIPGVGPLLTPAAETGESEGNNDASGNQSPPEQRPSNTATETGGETGDGEQADGAEPAPADSTAVNSDGAGSADGAAASADSSSEATPFRDGVNAANRASTLTQIASSSEDWNIVAEHWKDAVEGMKAVPSSHPRYELAQEKISEYQKNLDYARRLANP